MVLTLSAVRVQQYRRHTAEKNMEQDWSRIPAVIINITGCALAAVIAVTNSN
jgi:hypothetical protein